MNVLVRDRTFHLERKHHFQFISLTPSLLSHRHRLGYSRNQPPSMSPRSYSAYTNAYGASASTYAVPSSGFLNGSFDHYLHALSVAVVLDCLLDVSVVYVVHCQNGLSFVYHQQYESALKSPSAISPAHQPWNTSFAHSNSSSSTCSSTYILISHISPSSIRFAVLVILSFSSSSSL